MLKISLVIHNLRSSHNVGSILRTAEGLGVKEIYLTGYTPYPKLAYDQRLPHMQARQSQQISKTSLGAEKSLSLHQSDDVESVLKHLKGQGYQVIALEQTNKSQPIVKFKPSDDKLALILGREVEGIEASVLARSDAVIEIPMLGRKESYNVAVASAIALYHLRFMV